MATSRREPDGPDDWAADYAHRLVEASPGPLSIISPDGVILDVNSAVEEMTGRSRESLIGSRFDLQLTDGKAAWQALRQALEAGSVTDLPFVVDHMSGELREILVSASAFYDIDGQVASVLAAARDVTEERLVQRELSDQRDRLRLILGSARLGTWEWNMQTDEGLVDERFAEIVGYHLEDLMPTSNSAWLDMTHPDDVEIEQERTRRHAEGLDEYYDMESRMRHRDGSWVWVRDRGKIVEWDKHGRPVRMTGTLEDVTEARENADRLAAAEELLRVVLDNSPDPTLRFNADMRIEYVNHGIVEMSGRSAEEWKGNTLAGLGYSEELDSLWNGHARNVFTTKEPVVFNYVTPTVYGERWADASLAPELAPDGTVAHVVATIRDVTSRRRAEEELLRLATHDTLTGLANRAVLADELERAIQSAVRSGTFISVLMVDLDRFKNINDSLGHGIGDELIRGAADRMRAAVRGGDLVARTGGDEFVVVMRDLVDGEEAVVMAWDIVEAFRAPFTIAGQGLYATASVGVAIAGLPTPPDDLVREADTAMYVAKDGGRDRAVVYNSNLRAAVSSRLAIESDLRQALGRDELSVYYQPEVDLQTGQVTAVEALLRWNHPSGTRRSAETFIEIAEETGLIVPIGHWVLQQACRDAAEWASLRGDRAVVVRVNVSARQLAEDRLLESIDEALTSSGLDAQLLCIEITETALLRNSPQAHANIEGARRRGISVALDDFGTGYASLAYLRDYPIDTLKIDRTFITRITTVDFERQLTGGILAFAAQLGLMVTAEGVEHADQARVLRELGCRGAQGFLFSEAVPTDAVPALLASGFAPA